MLSRMEVCIDFSSVGRQSLAPVKLVKRIVNRGENTVLGKHGLLTTIMPARGWICKH
jgi:hypothetical protein